MSIIALLLLSFHGMFIPLKSLALARQVSKQWPDLAVVQPSRRCPEELLPAAVTSSDSLSPSDAKKTLLEKVSRVRLWSTGENLP